MDRPVNTSMPVPYHRGMKTAKSTKSIRMAAPEDGVAAVDRALRVLDAFDPEAKALGLTALAERAGLSKSTVLRLACSLMQRGYVRALPDGRYQLGPAVLRLAAVYQKMVQPEDVIRPMLETLVAESGESASFNVREGDVYVCLYRVDSKHALRDHIRPGQCFPLDRGATALVLRAGSGETGREYDDARARVTVVRHGELFEEMSGIAVPVFGMNQALAGAILLSGPTSRFTARAVARMESLLREAGATLTTHLGGSPLPFQLRQQDKKRRRA
ncbi:MAG: IclR family transcriptional regulator [Burkholderiales bacterium]|nr:IclR family transcriptional regulator [Burkholderiales bacterium]